MNLTEFRKKIHIKYFMVIYTAFLLLFSGLFQFSNDLSRLWKGALVVAIYCAADLVWTHLRDKLWYLPVSSVISGFILALVAIPSPPWPVLFALPIAAVASKQLLKFGKMRHVYNPAAFGMALVGFFAGSVSWWGVAWGNPVPLLPIIVAVGLFILWRQERFHVALPFIASYAILLSALFLSQGTPIDRLLVTLKPQIIDGTTIFFASVMLIEPLTSTFPTKKQRAIYGVMVAFFAVLMTYISGVSEFAQNIPGPLDPLVYGLCVGNLAASLLFLPPRKKPVPSPAPSLVK